MKLLTLLMLALVCFASAKPGLRHLEEEVSIEREFNDDGELPEGREVIVDSDHPIEDPPELKAKGLQDDHDRALTGGHGHGHGHGHGGHKKYKCYKCWKHHYYGWITYCCTYGKHGHCAYYYC